MGLEGSTSATPVEAIMHRRILEGVEVERRSRTGENRAVACACILC